MTVTGVIGATYTLDPNPVGSGGEGDVFNVLGMDSQVAKIYKPGVLTQELEEKLTVMIEYPPNETVMSQVAWPLDLLCDDKGQSCGFIMPKLSINAELGEIYQYPAILPISAQQKLNIAQNICVVISEVHQAGYIFGDFNPRNIGLDKNTGLVSFLDTDTYHVMNHSGNKTYRCNVCAPGYAAPELLAKCSDYIAENPSASKSAYAQTSLPTFTKDTDNFALAIHIFKLLMNGYTPFGGIIETAKASQAAPGIGDAAVRRDSYCFKPGYKSQSVAIPALDCFSNKIVDLFTRAFITGRQNPLMRPTAVEWHDALNEHEKLLVTCAHNELHQYDRKNGNCPLCAADERFIEAMGGSPTSRSLSQTEYRPSAPPVMLAPTNKTAQNSTQPIRTSISAPVPHVHSTPVTIPQVVDFIEIKGEKYSTLLESLDLRDMRLQNKDIIPLKYMTSLTALNLAINQISDLTPLSGLTKITSLILFNNQISNLKPLSGIRNLKFLNLYANPIRDWSPVDYVPEVKGRP